MIFLFRFRESAIPSFAEQASLVGFLHVVVISAQEIPERNGIFSKYKEAKVYVALNFRGERKCSKVVTQSGPKETTEWGEEMVWAMDSHAPSIQQEHIAVELLWESSLRDQQIGAVAVSVPSTKGVVQQKLWQLQDGSSSRVAGILLRCYVSDSAESDAKEVHSLETKEYSDPVVENPIEVVLDNISLGTYKVNVEVLEARGLPSRPGGGICSPFVCVQVDGGKKYFTASVARAGEHAAWYETFSFNLDVKDALDIRRAKLHLSCWDAGNISNQLIGTFDIELGFIYSQANHEIFRKWISLFNFQDENVGGIQGLILISVSVLGPEDKATVHNDSEVMPHPDENDLGILISPSVERKSYLVELRIYRATGLPQMDFTIASALGGQGIDAYVRLKFGGDVYSSTSSIVKSRNPSFNESIVCPVIIPSYSDTVEVNVMDYDFFDADDFVGTLFFSFHDLLVHKERYNQAQWWNLYGSPPCSDQWPAMPGPGGQMERSASAMNKGERAGTWWRGRILMSLHISTCPIKELRCKTAPSPILPLRREANVQNGEPQMVRFLITLRLFFACNVVTTNKLYVEVRIGERAVCKSADHVPVDGTVSWWEVLHGAFEVPLESGTPASAAAAPAIAWHSCPDVFVDVRDQKGRLGYVRVDLRACHSKADPAWHVVLPDEFDRCGPDSGFQGLLLFEARSGTESEMSRAPAIGDRIIAPPPKVRYRLNGHVYLAENLKADDNPINPFVMFSCCGQSWKSKAIYGGQHPAWYESFSIDFVSFKEHGLMSPLMVQVWNSNLIMSDDVLGFTTIPAASLLESPGEEVLPLWFELYHPDTNPLKRSLVSNCGSKILLALQIIEAGSETCKNCGSLLPETASACPACGAIARSGMQVPLKMIPMMKLCTLELGVVGLRDLKPCGVLPMASPFLSASLSSINHSTRASDRPSPTSPNIFQSVFFYDILLPTNPDLAPAVTIRANDRRFAGTVFLGSAPVHLAEYLPWISPDARKAARKTRHERESLAKPRSFPSRERMGHDLSSRPSTSQNAGTTLKMKVCVDEQLYSVDADHSGTGADDQLHEYLRGRLQLDSELERELLDDQDIDPCSEDSGIATYMLMRHATHFFSSEIVTYCIGRLKLRVCISEKGKDGPSMQPRIQPSMASARYIVRIYVLTAQGLASEDSNGSSDPYLRVSLGKHIISRREFSKSRCLDPVFHQLFEFQTELPGTSIVNVDVMDADTYTNDDLIGSTAIDLEERITSKRWLATGRTDDTSYPLRPLETRGLSVPGSSQCRGLLSLWVDIFTEEEARKFPSIDISIDPEPYVLRVVIWQVKGARSMDPLSNQNDLYIVGRLLCVNLDGAASTNRKQTDTHWRAKNGEGSFNWRWNFPVTMPLKDMQLTLQAWDKDIIGSDDLVGETTISLRNLIAGAALSDQKKYVTPLRFPSSSLIDKALKSKQSTLKPKKERRLAQLVRRQMKEGKHLDAIALQLRQKDGSGGENHVWTAEHVAAIAEAEDVSETGWQRFMSSLARCWRSCVLCCRSFGRRQALSPNPTAWIPLFCDAPPEESDGSQPCCDCFPPVFQEFAVKDVKLEGRSCSGWLELEAELIPQKYFEETASGEGQEEPNAHPYLPPASRVKLISLWYRPDLLMYEILGPELCCKMLLLAIVAVAIVGLVQTLPLIITNLYTAAQIESKFPLNWIFNKSA